MPTVSGPEPAAGQGEPQPVPEVDGYRVVARLSARGAQGTILEAFELAETARHVALKFPLGGALSSDRAMAMFENEVKTAASLEHPNIARVYKCDRQQGVLYYSMEWIDGVNLDEYVTQSDLTQRQILELMRTVCRAVQHAHQGGIIHRDLKPGNIMVATGESAGSEQIGQPKVLDFGLAVEESGGTLVTSMRGVGTPLYMAPEQAAGTAKRPTTAMDVYALGVMLYKLLTGSHPHGFTREELGVLSSHQVRDRIAREEVIRPRSVSKEIDKELETLLLKALAHEAELRYASAGELATDIDNYFNGEPLTARPPSTLYFLKKRIKKYRVPVAIAAAVMVALIGTGVFSYVRVAQERGVAVAANEQERHQRVRADEAAKKAKQEAEVNRRMLYLTRVSLAAEQYARGNDPAMRRLLDLCPKDLRRWEWDYLNRQRPHLLLKVEHEDVNSACLSPDGSRILSASGKSLRVWDSASGRMLMEISGGQSPAVFSPDGRRIASRHGQGISFWDAKSGKHLHILPDKPPFAISPDGRRIITANMTIFDAKSGEILLRIPAPEAGIELVTYSADGRRIAAAKGGAWWIWDASTGSQTHAHKVSEEGKMVAVAISLESRRVIVGIGPRDISEETLATSLARFQIIVYDMLTGEKRFALAGLDRAVRGGGAFSGPACFSEDGVRIASAEYVSFQVRDAIDGREITTFRQPLAAAAPQSPWWLQSLAFGKDGKRIVASGVSNDKGLVTLWEIEPEQEGMVLDVMSFVLEFTADSTRLLTSTPTPDGFHLYAWDLASGKELHELGNNKSQALCAVGYGPRGRTVAVKWGKRGFTIWDVETAKPVGRFEIDKNAEGKEPIHVFPMQLAGIAYSSDRKRFVLSIGGNACIVWDAATRKLLRMIPAGKNAVFLCTNGHLAARVEAPEGGLDIDDVFLSNAKQAEYKTSLLDVNTGQAKVDLSKEVKIPLRISKGGRWVLAFLSSGGLGVIRTDTGNVQSRLGGYRPRFHEGMMFYWSPVFIHDFSPDGERIVTVSADSKVTLWDTRTGLEILTLNSGVGIPLGVRFSHNGKFIAVAGYGGKVRVWGTSLSRKSSPKVALPRTRPSSAARIIGSPGTVTHDPYVAVRGGMREDEVKAILGLPKIKSSDSWTYVNDNPYYKAVIRFKNGRVTAKAWYDERGVRAWDASDPAGSKGQPPTKSATAPTKPAATRPSETAR